MATRIALDGLGSLLARMGKHVTVLFDYDSSVRGSMSDAFVIFDDAPIDNPVVEEADILLRLADRGHLHISGRKVVTDLGLGMEGDEQIPFASLGSQHFGRELFGNMIALGRLLNLAGIEFDEASIRDSLPRRYQDENVAAIRYGFELTAEQIGELAAAAPPSRFEMNDAATAPLKKRTGIHSGESLTDAMAAETG
jgi:Pyruvate/2-oxoacid:ferredoxin oxidoreductase gamma subunit